MKTFNGTMGQKIAWAFVITFLLSYPGYAQRNHVLLQETFESGNWSEAWTKDWDHAYNGVLVSASVRTGTRAMKFEWRKKDLDGTNSSKHAELATAPLPAGEQERWYGFSVFLPDSGMASDAEPEIISQWHQSPDTKEGETWTGAGPALSLSYQNGKLGLTYKWDTRRIMVKGDGVSVKKAGFSLGNAVQNRWIDFVFHIRWDAFGEGILQVWKDDSLMVSKFGIPIGYNDERKPYWKLGIYKYTGKSDYAYRRLYYDDIRIGGAKAGYQDVVPKNTHSQVAWRRGKLLYHDAFDRAQKNWIPELEKRNSSSVVIGNGQLDLAAKGGATLWFRPELQGNIQIEYNATVISHSPNGANLNQFWMASEPSQKKLSFSHHGKFAEYDTLRLYYAGLGGNDNTTSRFRKYLTDGTKPVLQEYTDKAHFPEVGKTYSIRIQVYQGTTRLAVNNETYFEFNDPSPYTKGHFAFRTFNSHIRYSDFNVYRLEPANASGNVSKNRR